MTTRRDVVLQGLLAGALASAGAHAQTGTGAPQRNSWVIPPNDGIRTLLADRIDNQRRGVGIVVGVIEPAGRRVVAYGSSGNGRRLGGDTVFQIGSVSKVFATLVLADMVLRGEVKLDDPAARYLPPGVSMPERGRQITLADLATHMSGLPSMPTNFALKAAPNPIAAYTPGQLYAFLSTYQLPREPGAAYLYSNLGVSLLGRLLARRAGIEYQTLVKQRVLKPLGLASTSITLSAEQHRRLAPGHDMYLKPVDTWEMRTLQASGSLRSTADDLLAFLAAHLGYRDTPLKAAMAFQTHQPRPPNSGNQSLGWSIRTNATFGEIDFLHTGGKEGYRSVVVFNPDTRTGVVILANTRSDDDLTPLALHLLSGRALPAPAPMPAAPAQPRTVRLPRSLLDAYEGRYQLTPDVILAVGCRDGRLLMDALGEGVSEFFPAGEGSFFSKVSASRITFQTEAGGQVSALTLHEDETDRLARKISN